MSDTVTPALASSPDIVAKMREVLSRQHAAFLADGPPPAELRIDRIDRVIALLLENQTRLCKTFATDFSWRSHDQSLLTDVLLPIRSLRHARANARRRMKPARRRPQFGMDLLGATALE